MPHFENFDQYETTDPKTGQKKVMPIAPHSLTTMEFRPRKRPNMQVRPAKPVDEFPKVEIEPVSIEQMEREFRQAKRLHNRTTLRGNLRTLARRLSRWLGGLLKRAPRKPDQDRRGGERREGDRQRGRDRGPQQQHHRQGRPRDQQRQHGRGQGGGQGRPQGQQHQQSQQRPPQQKPPQQQQGQPQQGQQHQQQRPGAEGQPQGQQRGGRDHRRRRNRRPPGQGPSGGGSPAQPNPS